MPPKKEIIKKKKRPLKQKQKQKQSVRQNVKVTVQSSGGSGAGGTSVPAMAPQIQYVPQYQPMPASFLDRSGENVAQRNLVQEAVKMPVPVKEAPVRTEMKSKSSEPIPYDPANDVATFKAVFGAASDLLKPLMYGRGEPDVKMKAPKKAKAPEVIREVPVFEQPEPIAINVAPVKARKQRSDAGKPRKTPAESATAYVAELQAQQKMAEDEATASQFQPSSFPARDNYLSALEMKQKFGMM